MQATSYKSAAPPPQAARNWPIEQEERPKVAGRKQVRELTPPREGGADRPKRVAQRRAQGWDILPIDDEASGGDLYDPVEAASRRGIQSASTFLDVRRFPPPPHRARRPPRSLHTRVAKRNDWPER